MKINSYLQGNILIKYGYNFEVINDYSLSVEPIDAYVKYLRRKRIVIDIQSKEVYLYKKVKTYYGDKWVRIPIKRKFVKDIESLLVLEATDY
jgi:L-cysteine desulfidase